eukprot:PhF_6_TR9254/c0_g1_i2/m.14653
MDCRLPPASTPTKPRRRVAVAVIVTPEIVSSVIFQLFLRRTLPFVDDVLVALYPIAFDAVLQTSVNGMDPQSAVLRVIQSVTRVLKDENQYEHIARVHIRAQPDSYRTRILNALGVVGGASSGVKSEAKWKIEEHMRLDVAKWLEELSPELQANDLIVTNFDVDEIIHPCTLRWWRERVDLNALPYRYEFFVKHVDTQVEEHFTNAEEMLLRHHSTLHDSLIKLLKSFVKKRFKKTTIERKENISVEISALARAHNHMIIRPMFTLPLSVGQFKFNKHCTVTGIGSITTHYGVVSFFGDLKPKFKVGHPSNVHFSRGRREHLFTDSEQPLTAKELRNPRVLAFMFAHGWTAHYSDFTISDKKRSSHVVNVTQLRLAAEVCKAYETSSTTRAPPEWFNAHYAFVPKDFFPPIMLP